MEQPSKRRRVEGSLDRSAGHYGFQIGRGRNGILTDRKEKEGLVSPKLGLPSHEDHVFNTLLRFPRREVQRLYDPLKSSEDGPRRLQTRGLVPSSNTPVNSNIPAQVAQPISTVVNVAVSNGKDIFSSVVVPLAPTPSTVPGFNGLTMAPVATPALDNTPTPASKVGPNPGNVTPPAAVAASEAREQAIQSQQSQAIAHEYAAILQAPASSATPENRAAASQSPMAVLVSGSSQQVLSSPSTPIPSVPQSSSSPSASYFSSSPVSAVASSTSSIILNSPTPSPTLSPNVSQMPSSSNSSTSTTTLSGSSTSASMSMTSLNSEASSMSASLFAQSSASEASISSVSALAPLASASQNLSGFVTATRTGQSISRITSGQITSSPTSLSASTSSQLSQSSRSAASVSASAASGSGSGSVSGLGAGGIGGSSNTRTAPSPTSSPGGGSGGSSAPPTNKLVGGVIGGIAGLVMVLVLILYWFRWRRRRIGQRRVISPPVPQTIVSGAVPQAGSMTQRSSTAPIAAAGFFSRLRPVSSQTAATVATTDTAPSERGFQKISGRKLTSVLASGGDGYGDPPTTGPSTAPSGRSERAVAPVQGPFAGLVPAVRPSPSHSLSGSSFYRDSHGFYGGVVPASDQTEATETSSSPSSSPTYPAPLVAATRGPQGRGSPSSRREEGLNMRPGPARTPVINQPAQLPQRTPSRATPPGPSVRNTPPPISEFPRLPRDGLGRSHPSQDGSRGSRFREDTTPP